MDTLTETLQAYRMRPAVYAARNADAGADLHHRFQRALPAGCRVLDAGCGPGRDLVRFTAAGHQPVGVDLCPEFAGMAAAHGPVVVGDLRALTFGNGSFGAVWACASLVHLPDDEVAAALAELARVASAGAPVLVSVKGEGQTGWRRDHMGWRWFNVWTAGRLAAVARAAGLRIRAVDTGPVWVDLWAVA